MASNNCDFMPCQNAIICGIVCTCHLHGRTKAQDAVGLFLELPGKPVATHCAIQLIFMAYRNFDFMPCRNAIICGIVCTCHLPGRIEDLYTIGLFLDLPDNPGLTEYVIQSIFITYNYCDFMSCPNSIIFGIFCTWHLPT